MRLTTHALQLDLRPSPLLQAPSTTRRAFLNPRNQHAQELHRIMESPFEELKPISIASFSDNSESNFTCRFDREDAEYMPRFFSKPFEELRDTDRKMSNPTVTTEATQPNLGLFLDKPRQSKISCNCIQSHCLKKYCECFKNGQDCGDDCNCLGCRNRDIDKDSRKDHKKVVIFCNCLRTGCSKRYCECLSAGKPCGELCRCLACKNQLSIFNGQPPSSLGSQMNTRQSGHIHQQSVVRNNGYQ